MNFKNTVKNALVTVFAAASLTACFQKNDKDPATELGRVHIDTIDAVKPKPADTAALPAKPVAAKAADSVKVSFRTEKDTAALVRKYPFLDSLVTDLYAEAREAAGSGDSLSSGNIEVDVSLSTSLVPLDGRKDGAKLLFVRTEGALYAGSQGTPVDIYLKAEGRKNFAPVLSVTTMNDITVERGTPLKLVLPTESGPAVWVLKAETGAFELLQKAKPANISATP